jgi:hypothetical protein
VYNSGIIGDTIVKTLLKQLLLVFASGTACLGTVQAEIKKICMGEATSGQVIGHSSGGTFDSAIGEAEDCLFSANSAVGRQINKVCGIRDMSMTVEPGGTCRIEAVIQNKAIKRIITIRSMDATPSAPGGGLCE